MKEETKEKFKRWKIVSLEASLVLAKLFLTIIILTFIVTFVTS